MRRRHALLPLLASLSPAAWPQASAPSHDPFGPVRPPLPLPDLALTGEDGRSFQLSQRLRGRITALQLMFTGCSTSCPLQGALFAALAPQVVAQREMQLLSVSIDALGDTPAALTAWLAKFGAPAHWRAAVPRVTDVDRLLDFLRGRASGADRHTAQVYLIDRQGRLAYRTADLPPARFVADTMDQMARMR